MLCEFVGSGPSANAYGRTDLTVSLGWLSSHELAWAPDGSWAVLAPALPKAVRPTPPRRQQEEGQALIPTVTPRLPAPPAVAAATRTAFPPNPPRRTLPGQATVSGPPRNGPAGATVCPAGACAPAGQVQHYSGTAGELPSGPGGCSEARAGACASDAVLARSDRASTAAAATGTRDATGRLGGGSAEWRCKNEGNTTPPAAMMPRAEAGSEVATAATVQFRRAAFAAHDGAEGTAEKAAVDAAVVTATPVAAVNVSASVGAAAAAAATATVSKYGTFTHCGAHSTMRDARDHECAGSASQRVPLPYGCCLPYRPYIRRASVFAKIPGYWPTQITPGYEQRLALLLEARGGGSGGGDRRLGSVYVRSGCVELILEEEEWGAEDELELREDGEAAVAMRLPASGDDSYWMRGGNGNDDAVAAAVSPPPPPPLPPEQPLQPQQGTSGSFAGGTGVSEDGAAVMEVAEAAAATAATAAGRVNGSSSPSRSNGSQGTHSQGSCSSHSSLDLAAIIRALQLRDEQEDTISEELAAEWREEDEEPQCGALGSETARSGGATDAAAATVTGGGGVTADDEAKPPYSTADPAESELRHACDSVSPPAAPPPAAANRRSAQSSIITATISALELPFLVGFAGERQMGIQFVVLQPRVLLLSPRAGSGTVQPPLPALLARQHADPGAIDPPAEVAAADSALLLLREASREEAPPGQPPHRPPPQQQQQQHLPRRAVRTRSRVDSQQQRQQEQEDPGSPPDRNPSQAQNNHQELQLHTWYQADGAHSPADSATRRPASAAAATVALRAVVHCPAAVTAEEGPGALEVLLRSYGKYLTLRARWRDDRDAATTVLTAAAGGGEHGDGDIDADVDAGGQGSMAGPGGGGAVVPRPLPDSVLGSDVNRLHVLELELLELPTRPGIALVDFRWRGAPCRAVPLVLTAQPAVANELQAAVAGWTRPQHELDELLLDFGTWEHHVSVAVQRLSTRPPTMNPPWGGAAAGGGGGVGDSGETWQPLSAARLLDLSLHLLRYMTACGWLHSAIHIESHVYLLSAAGLLPPLPGHQVLPPVAGTCAGSAAVAAAAAAAAEHPGEGEGVVPATAAAATAEGANAAAMLAGGTAIAAAQAARAQFHGVLPPTSLSLAYGGGGQRPAERKESAVVVQGRTSGVTASAAATYDSDGGDAGTWTSPALPRIPWASAVLLPALGFGRTAPAETAAFNLYTEPWIVKLSPVLLFFDLSCLGVLLLRERCQLLAPSSPSVLLACLVSMLLLLAWLVLPYATWVRLLPPSRYARLACYCAAKGLVAYGGFPLPLGVRSYAAGGALLLSEGVLLPAASVLPPAAAVLCLSALAAMTSKMLLVAGAATHGSGAAAHSFAVLALGLATTIGCNACLRYHFWWHLRGGAVPGRRGQGQGQGCRGLDAAARQLHSKKETEKDE